MTRITITNPDEGTFRLVFTNPNDLKRSTSEEIKVSNDGNKVADRIKGYYNKVGVNPIVTAMNLDAAGEETEEKEAIVTRVFEIRLDRLVDKESTSDIVVKTGTSKSKFQVERNVVKSGPPMTGTWKVRCVYSDNTF